MLTSSSCHPHSDTQRFQEQSGHLLGPGSMVRIEAGWNVGEDPIKSPWLPGTVATPPFTDVTWSHIHIQIARILDTKVKPPTF